MSNSQPLRIFLCHAKEDKLIVRELYRQLTTEDWLDVWFDEEQLLPGQEWDIEIEKAVEQADIVAVCLSNKSVDKEGYVQKEIRFVLNIADEKPEGAIFVIPLRLDDCIVPRRLRAWQWVDYFPRENQEWAYRRLLKSLKLRAAKLGIENSNYLTKENQEQFSRQKATVEQESVLLGKIETEQIAKKEEQERLAKKRIKEVPIAKKQEQLLATQQAGHESQISATPTRHKGRVNFYSWWDRMLLGSILGVVLCLILTTQYLTGNPNDITILIIMAIGGGITGAFLYPHKVSIVIIVTVTMGFFLMALLGNESFKNSFFYGILFGLPLGAIASRVIFWILHLLKVSP